MNVPTILRRPKRLPSSLSRFLAIVRVFKPTARPSRRRVSHRLTAPVTVWDARLGAFRSVNLHNFHDPLWEAAKALAVQSELSQRPGSANLEPADDRCAPRTETSGSVASDVPGSPFGGSNHVAAGLHDLNEGDSQAGS